MRKLISLGFSCQSRFCIDFVSAEHRRLPFDYNVTTKAALLQAFHSDGDVFRLADESALSVHRAPKEGREGVDAGGVYLWHDFDLNSDQSIGANWRAGLPLIREKYAAMWGRFRRLLTSPATPITFIVSNTQINLGEYAVDFDDFSTKFRITTAFIADLRQTLVEFGVQDFEILVLNRFLRDSIELNHAIQDPWFRSVFAGRLTLPTNARLAASILSDIASDGGQSASLSFVGGVYEGGWRIVPLTDQSAAITKDGEPVGELRPMRDGYIATFDGDADDSRTVMRLDEGALYWSDKARWMPTKGA